MFVETLQNDNRQNKTTMRSLWEKTQWRQTEEEGRELLISMPGLTKASALCPFLWTTACLWVLNGLELLKSFGYQPSVESCTCSSHLWSHPSLHCPALTKGDRANQHQSSGHRPGTSGLWLVQRDEMEAYLVVCLWKESETFLKRPRCKLIFVKVFMSWL